MDNDHEQNSRGERPQGDSGSQLSREELEQSDMPMPTTQKEGNLKGRIQLVNCPDCLKITIDTMELRANHRMKVKWTDGRIHYCKHLGITTYGGKPTPQFKSICGKITSEVIVGQRVAFDLDEKADIYVIRKGV